MVYRDLGRPKESLRQARKAIEILDGLEDPQAEAYVLSSMAESHRMLGHNPSALSCLKRSLRLRRRVGDTRGEVGVLHDLAAIHDALGGVDVGRRAREQAASVAETLGESPQAIVVVERSN